MGDNFDVDLGLLPPRLQMELWVLGLDADTSRVNIAYRNGTFRSNLAYNYGGNVEASFGIRRLKTKVAVSPTSGQVDVDLGYVYRGFRFGTSTRVHPNVSVGVNIGYGARLLPFPQEMASVFNDGGSGLASLAGNIQQAPNNPLAWYGLHSDDVAAVTRAVSLGQRINASSTEGPFGAGLRLNYSRQNGLTIYGGVQLRF